MITEHYCHGMARLERELATAKAQLEEANETITAISELLKTSHSVFLQVANWEERWQETAKYQAGTWANELAKTMQQLEKDGKLTAPTGLVRREVLEQLVAAGQEWQQEREAKGYMVRDKGEPPFVAALAKAAAELEGKK